jgi:hypothetical protein
LGNRAVYGAEDVITPEPSGTRPRFINDRNSGGDLSTGYGHEH